ncbi:hypothetical protein DV737_g2929, partial [Chaetothyriales sp. CBS 132003]
MALEGEDVVQDLGTSTLRRSTPPPSGLRQRHLARAATFGEPSRSLNRRRSSIFSESLSDARRSIKSSTEDLFVPRISTSEQQDAEESSHWHSLPLALALLPAVGGLFFQDGSAILTDLSLLAISAVFMNWALRVPWDWYRGAQSLSLDQIESPAASTPTEDDEIQVSENAPLPSKMKAKEKSKSPKSTQAQFELRTYELLALASCFTAPALAAWLLHAIRSQLSRPSEGLVSNYNLTVFLLVAEIRPLSHLIKLMQRRTLFLQRTVNAESLQVGSHAKDLVLNDLSTRIEELERHLAERIESPVVKSNESPDSIISKASTQALSDIKTSIQPELDALGRAMRRYEKRSTISAVQFDARLKELEASLKDVVVLAAAAQRNVEQRPTNYIYVLANWICAMVVVPIRASLSILALQQRMAATVLAYEGQAIETIIRDDGKFLRSFEILPQRIGIDIKGWLIEAWRRLDPRISYEDIIERMTADPEFCQGKGLIIPSKNSLQMHTLRSCRKLLGYWQLEGQKEEPSRAMVEAIERLTPSNLLYNTVLPICESDPNRLVKLKFERKTEDGQFKAVPLVVTADNINKVTLPLDFFCQYLQDNASATSAVQSNPGIIGLVDRLHNIFQMCNVALLICNTRSEILAAAIFSDMVHLNPATPQYPYEPSLSDSGHASFSDSSQDILPNMDWDDDVFRFLLHSDEANEPPEDIINTLSSLPDGAAVKELGSPLSMHAAKHLTVDHTEITNAPSASPQ